MTKKYRKQFDNLAGNPLKEIDKLLKEIKDLQQGRLMAHADGSVTND